MSVFLTVPKNTKEKILARVDRSGGPDTCWFWTGFVENGGYGRVGFHGKRTQAHRFIYEEAVGPIPEGLLLRHLCEGRYPRGDISYRRCCNPAHLAPGTAKQNTADRERSGRGGTLPDNSGEANGRSRLTASEVLEIRAWSDVGGWPHRSLADAFGVSRRLVGLIHARKIWKKI